MAARLRALRRFARGRGFDARALPRLARASARRALARHPVDVRLRLRVRARPAPARLPRRDPRRRPGGDPAGPSDRLGARAREGRRYPGLKEEYYLARTSAGSVRARRLGARPVAPRRRRPDATRGLALPRQANTLFRRRARAARPARRCQPVVPPRTPAQRARFTRSRPRRSSSPTAPSTRSASSRSRTSSSRRAAR